MIDEDKITRAQHRIEDLYHKSQGKCYVSFSGGKDSTVVLALVKSCQELGTIGDVPAVFVNTGIEMGVTVDFVKWTKENWYPGVEIIRPEKSFDWVLTSYGKPLKSKMKAEFLSIYRRNPENEYMIMALIQGVSKGGKPAKRTKIADKDMHMLHPDFSISPSPKCCNHLKKTPFKKYEKQNGMVGCITGIRKDEGGARALSTVERVKNGGSLCTVEKRGITYKYPIIDWTEEDVEAYIEACEVHLSKAYTEFGFYRTGCMACPFSTNLPHDLQYLHDHEPSRYKAAMHWLKDVYIAQNVVLTFDPEYEREREREWRELYEPMRQEMLRKYRPESRLIKGADQMKLF